MYTLCTSHLEPAPERMKKRYMVGGQSPFITEITNMDTLISHGCYTIHCSVYH